MLTLRSGVAGAAALLLSLPSLAADPASGTLTTSSAPIVYTTGPFFSANATPVPLVDTSPTCGDPAPMCDSFELTVSLPAGYAAAHNADYVRVTTAWVDSGGGASDYDLWVYKGQVGATSGSDVANFRGAGGTNPEVAQIIPLLDGDTIYTIKIVPYTPSGEVITTTIELVTGDSIPTDPTFGVLEPEARPGAPRYQNWVPTGLLAEDGNGECNIGFNPNTMKIMFMCFGNGSVYRLTAPESIADAPLPEACQAQWEDVTPLATSGPQPVADPILFTDAISGRTWASNLTAGPNVSYAFTDDDGDTWIEGGGGSIAGADHQTIGSGPYPADFVLPHPLHENATYFCSQAIAGPAGCIRSDDGGATWGPPALAYDGSLCSGLHGHVHVALDGTVWLPVETCGEGTGYAISTDAGQTWTDHMIPTSASTAGSDPSVALDDDSTAYFCYINGDGHARVTVSRDRGETWTDDVDLGEAYGVVNSAFPEAWGGSSGRAACGFLGTDRVGNFQSLDFPGLWYLFMAHTYDGGKTWTTVNATPNDPVQGIGGIWQGGGSDPNRNLLDFNEVTADQNGRVLFGYDDGCVRDCAQFPLDNPQSFTALMKVARQTGGKSLRAEFDQPEPRLPANACLYGTRDQFASSLTWSAPDHGGAAISNYKVFRSTSPTEAGAFVGNAGPKLGYIDRSVDPNVEKYYYTVTAENSVGESVASNQIALPVVPIVEETSCVIPGITLYTDPSDDSTSSGVPGHELLGAALAEPKDMPGKLVLTMKVDSLSPQPPAGSRWATYYDKPDGSGVGYVAMVTTDGLPTFEYGTKDSIGGTVGTFTPDGTPDEASAWSADGTIAIVLDKATMGFVDGAKLTGLWTVVRSSSPADGGGLTVDDTPQTTYDLRGTAICDAPPVGGGGGGGGSGDDGRFGGGAFGGAALLALLGLFGLRRRIAA